MTATLEEANKKMRQAVETRLAATPADDPKMVGYKPPPLAGCKPAEACAADVLSQAWHSESCCEGRPFRGDSLLAGTVHPTSQRFYELCDRLKAMHASKSRDYGCPSGTDPLANIRNGAKFVGIPAWRAAMVRLSDKVTRLATFNATGTLHNEGVVDTLEDLASYALLSLLLYQEEHGA